MIDRLESIARRYHDIESEMGRPEVASDHARLTKLAREQRSMREIVGGYDAYRRARNEMDSARELLKHEKDPAMQEYLRDEERRASAQLAELDERLKVLLLPKDPNDDKDVIVEIQGAEGGEEAALFAADLFRMYQRWAERKGWKIEVVEVSPSEKGGFDKIAFEVHGHGAYSQLKYEAGVHRVQRVPKTEAQGRVHTSAATVTVMPEADPVEVELKPEDIEVKTSTSTGFSSTSTGSASGITVTVAAEVWTRPCASVFGTRCTRWTPASYLSCEYAPWPWTSKAILSKPPFSEGDTSTTSIFQPLRSAHL